MKKFILSLVLLFLLACKDDGVVDPPIDPPIAPPQDHIYPMGKGYYWFYQNQLLDYNGNFESVLDTVGFKIVDEVTLEINGSPIKVYNQHFYNHKTYAVSDIAWQYYFTDNAVIKYSGIAPNDTMINPQVNLKFPVKTEDIWNRRDIIYNLHNQWELGKFNHELKCIATDSLFKTHIGEFNCYVFRQKAFPQMDDVASLFEYDFFYAKKVGLVGIVLKTVDPYDGEVDFKTKSILYKTNLINQKE